MPGIFPVRLDAHMGGMRVFSPTESQYPYSLRGQRACALSYLYVRSYAARERAVHPSGYYTYILCDGISLPK